MIAKIYSAIPFGYDSKIVEVEGDTNKGLPSFNIVGMASKTISESRERVRSALANSGYSFPNRKVTINLAPAELEKDGSHLDLPIAIAVLILAKQLSAKATEHRLFAGELSLDGKIRPIKGIIHIMEAAKQAGFEQIYIPIENLTSARLIFGIDIIGVDNLTELFLILTGARTLPTKPELSHQQESTPTESNSSVLLEHIHGQSIAKRALVIAIAGHHNILLSGPPGAGKTLLARAAHSLLPAPSHREQIDISKIHSLFQTQTNAHLSRPFRAPHHTASASAIIGGGGAAIPGEISLAHTGVLFLDELPEFPKNILEALRQPLEDGYISISRAKARFVYPARFILFATMNPCPCGYAGDPTHECECNPTQIQNYQKRISGPILDRIDITLKVDRIKTSEISAHTNDDNQQLTTQEAQEKISIALDHQEKRYQKSGFYNSYITSHQALKICNLTQSSKQLLDTAADKLNLSARSYFKIIKVARTIADLDSIEEILPEHISEALSYRQSI